MLHRSFRNVVSSMTRFSSHLPSARLSSVQLPERESMEYDVCIVGGGPAGLSTAIRLKQLAQKEDKEISVCILEKGSEIGAHILSGNCFEPRVLTELIPDWKEKGAPLETLAKRDKLYFLTKNMAIPLPTPPTLHNEGNYIISLSRLCQWLGAQAEEAGVDILPGFSASEVLYDADGAVCGVATRDQGISKSGELKPTFTRGMELRAKQTVLAEGVRGSLSELVMEKFGLRHGVDPQTYGIGIKEIWEVDKSVHEAGKIVHTIGWPIQTLFEAKAYGGSFLYHMDPNLILVGYVIGLDYKNPYLNPYEEFQRFKTHPSIKHIFENGSPISYGARIINEGGYFSIPKLAFPGGLLVGCSAGFLNVAKIKGSHTAMKSGMVAAENIFKTITSQDAGIQKQIEIENYQKDMKKSWVYDELYKTRNTHGSFEYGMTFWMGFNALDNFILKGNAPVNFHNKHNDYEKTGKKKDYQPIEYPKPDGKITFDLLTNLQRSGTNHAEDQPIHLTIKEGKEDKIIQGYEEYAAPEQRFCPAKVYEFTTDEDGSNPKLIRNAQNCLHCKACDVKTPFNYIRWTVPEGGGGPAYSGMM